MLTEFCILGQNKQKINFFGVPTNSLLEVGTVPTNSLLEVGTVPTNSLLEVGTGPTNSHNQKLILYYQTVTLIYELYLQGHE